MDGLPGQGPGNLPRDGNGAVVGPVRPFRVRSTRARHMQSQRSTERFENAERESRAGVRPKSMPSADLEPVAGPDPGAGLAPWPARDVAKPRRFPSQVLGTAAARAPRPGARGRAALLWIGLVAVAALLGLATFLASPPRAAQDPESGTTAPGRPAAGVNPTGAPESAGGARTEAPADEPPVLETARSARGPRQAPGSFDERVLDGKGRIRGFVQAPAGVDFPLEWTLLVGPSPSMIGHERAESRTLSFQNGEREFALEDLPLGGYALCARAYGLASLEQHLLLAKPGETDVYVSMQFGITAVVEGSVRLADSAAVLGLELSLEPRPAGVRQTATSDLYGHFTFTDVRQGGYTLHFGSPENPVREAIEVNVVGPFERLGDLTVPKMCELVVRAQTELGAPVRGVQIDGYGDHGGRFSGLTDEQGEVRARFLPAGRITVDARSEDGRSRRGRKLVDDSGPGILVLVFEQ